MRARTDGRRGGCAFAPQISHEFERFSAYLPDVVVTVIYGGVDIKAQKEALKAKPPHVVVGTPGRIKSARRVALFVSQSDLDTTSRSHSPFSLPPRPQLAKDGDLNLKSVRHFVLDECDKMLEALGAPRARARVCFALLCLLTRGTWPDMRADIQEIFKKTPHDKQVMMFSATLRRVHSRGGRTRAPRPPPLPSPPPSLSLSPTLVLAPTYYLILLILFLRSLASPPAPLSHPRVCSPLCSKEIRPVCKKFMTDPMEIYVDDEAKLTLHGLVQHYIKLAENEKNRKLTDLLDALDFNQVVIFVRRRASGEGGIEHSCFVFLCCCSPAPAPPAPPAARRARPS